MKVKFKKLILNAQPPRKAHPTDAGFDLTATSRIYDRHGALTYGTGLAVEIPEGHVGLIFPRSSVFKKDILQSNSVGVIDSGYRGEIMVKFKPALVYADRDRTGCDETDYEGSDQTDPRTQFVTFHGRDERYPDIGDGCLPFPPRVYEIDERIAQLIIIPIPDITFEEADTLSDTERGKGGYGSTGK